jgi:hypothetical protein
MPRQDQDPDCALSEQVRDAKEAGGGDVAPIPVTVRQLEALVRISESLPRMELATTVTDRHVSQRSDSSTHPPSTPCALE